MESRIEISAPAHEDGRNAGFIGAAPAYPEECEPVLSAGREATHQDFAEAGADFVQHLSVALEVEA